MAEKQQRKKRGIHRAWCAHTSSANVVKPPENKPSPWREHGLREDIPIKERGQETSQEDLVFDTGT